MVFLVEPSVPVAGNLRDRRSGFRDHKEGPKSEHREDNDNELTTCNVANVYPSQ